MIAVWLAAAAAPATTTPAVTVPHIVPDCRRDPDEGVVVCGRQTGRSPYRLAPPEGFNPDGPVDSVSRERHRLMEEGGSGIGSCSTVGPGGWTGCDFIAWKQEHQQKDGNARVGFGAKPPQ